MTLTWNELIGKLQRVDSRVRGVLGPNKVSGIYIKYGNKHPDAKVNGFVHVGGAPSPRFVKQIRPDSWIDEKGEFHRGWVNSVKQMAGKGHLKPAKLDSVFGKRWRMVRTVDPETRAKNEASMVRK